MCTVKQLLYDVNENIMFEREKQHSVIVKFRILKALKK